MKKFFKKHFMSLIAVSIMAWAIAIAYACFNTNQAQANVVETTEYDKGYNAGYDTGALCGSKLGYDGCVELLERADDL